MILKNHPIDGDTEQRQTRNQHAGDRTRLEGDAETGAEARRSGGLRRPHVGADRDVHADITGGARENGADEEPDGHGQPEEKSKPHADDDAGDGDCCVLSVEVGARALLNGGCDFLHALRSGRGGENRSDCINAVEQRQNAAGDNQHGYL